MGIFHRKKKETRALPEIAISTSTFLHPTKNTTVVACKNMLVDSVSNLPLNVYFRKSNSERIIPYNHNFYQLFKTSPNGEEPTSSFIGRIVDNLIESGNAFIFVQRNREGNVASLWLLDPEKVAIKRNEANQKYFVLENKHYSQNQILHIPGKYYNGREGKSLTLLARDAIDLSNNLDAYTKYHFENMISGGRLKIDITQFAEKNSLTDGGTQTKKFIQSISNYLSSNYTGAQNAGKSLILPPGISAEQLETASNQNNQLAELRELQERQICQVFDIPYDIFRGENKYNSLEQRNELFKNRTLQFWTNRICDYLQFLFTPYERERYYFEFDYNTFLKTDKKSRTENQIKQLQNGVLTINEIRRMENQTSIDPEIGDMRFIPNTFIPLTEENIKAYFAKSKLSLEELGKHNTGSGDDKS